MTQKAQKQAFDVLETLVKTVIDEMELSNFIPWFCGATNSKFCQQSDARVMSFWFEFGETVLVAETSIEKAVARALVHLINLK